MGGSSSSSKHTENITNTTTNVTTNTSTNIGEIGLTGQDAVAVTDILTTGGVMMSQVQGDTIKTIVQEGGEGYKQLVGGANNLIASAEGLNKDLLNTTEFVSGNAFDLGAQGIGFGESLADKGAWFGESLAGKGQKFGESAMDTGSSFGSDLAYLGGDVIKQGKDLIEGLFGKAQDITGSMVGAAQTFGQSLVKAGEGIANPAGQALDTANQQTKAIKTVALVGIAVTGAYFLFRMRRR